ncbi:MAG: hypothetical protein U1F76_17620 [Candidatus Competibacteraceae bacterium]
MTTVHSNSSPKVLCGLELHRPGTTYWAVILPNPSSVEPPFKVQRFGLAGFERHTAYPTAEAALKAAMTEGYTEGATGILSLLVRSVNWQAAYQS